MAKVYGVTMQRRKGSGPRFEGVIVRADSCEAAIAKVLLKKRFVDRVEGELLGEEESKEFEDRHLAWVRSVLSAKHSVCVGGFLND